MIIHVTGDLLESDCAVIAHSANCFHLMGHGIAPLIKARYPEAWHADLKTEKGANKLGEFSCAYVKDTGDCILVYNLYGQYHPGREANLAAIKSALEKMREDALDKFKYWPKCGIPALGCGIGGLSIDALLLVLEDVFSEHDIYLYTLQK